MSVELVHSQPPIDVQIRLIRMLADALILRELSRAEAKAVYREIEMVRDELSKTLDRADGKHA